VNLVVYLSDALRADHVGCYGARFVNTRTIDELAAGGVRFDQAIAVAPWTCPSMASMTTGLAPHHHGVFHWDVVPDPAVPTLFTTLAAAGYEIASFVFDESYLFKGYADANVAGLSVTLDGAVEWLRARDGSKPFLLFFHSWATHMPYDVLHAERREWLAAKQEIIDGIQSGSAAAYAALREGYARAVEHSSEVLLASFLEELDRLGLRERTAVAFVSDHGESWGERFADKTDVKGTYHLHGATLNEEIVQVPLILSAPGLEPAVVSSQVRTIDLFPTLAELAGAPIDGTIDGASLLPLAERRETGDRPAILGATDGGALSQLAIRQPPWKLILRLDRGGEEAYDLATDPRELESRPGDVPQKLRERLYEEHATAIMREPTAEEEAIVASRLTDLGYL
jgi:arylsulfatase A-like enzyme